MLPMRTHRPLRNLLLLALVAAVCFGGSFTCSGSTHDNDNRPNTGVTGGPGVNAR
jgi:hypothetical protein